MKINERERNTSIAESEISLKIEKIAKEHDLSDYELIEILASKISSITKYAIRVERENTET